MPFEDYNQLVDEIDDLIGRGDLRTKIQGWITLAEQDIVQRVRELTDVIFIFTGTFTAGTATLTLPVGTTGIKALQVNENPIKIVTPLSIRDLEIDKAKWSAVNRTFPQFYGRISDTQIEMSPIPQANSPYTIYFNKLYTAITEASTTSQLLAQAPEALLYGAAKHSSPYLRNERGQEWEALYLGKVRAYNKFLARISRATIQNAPYGADVDDSPSGSW